MYIVILTETDPVEYTDSELVLFDVDATDYIDCNTTAMEEYWIAL